MKTAIIPSLLCILFVISFHSCKSPTAPKDKNQTDTTTVHKSDTTSHNFSWELYSFGEASDSDLHDVAIIDENNIWAVGEIFMNDSTGQVDPLCYNAVHWDGSKWTVLRISVNFRGTMVTPPLRGIVAFSSNDIWVSAGLPIHGDGNSWTVYDLTATLDKDLALWRGWGTDSKNMYFAGSVGSLVHYDGKKWEKLNSGTTMELNDIYGATDPNTGKEEILAVGSNNYPPEHIILSIDGNKVTQISSKPIKYELSDIWFVPNQHYYLVGSGIFEKNLLSDSLWVNGPLDKTRKASTGICANGLNDVFIVGSYGEVQHYNGSTCKSFINETGIDGCYGRADIKGNLLAVPGYQNRKAVILIGRRK